MLDLQITQNKQIFDHAEPEYERAYFDPIAGGYVLVHEGHNRGESFGSELFLAEEFAKKGSTVILLDESDAVIGKCPDAEIDGEIWDFKTLTRETQRLDRRVQEGYLTARKQGASGVAYHVARSNLDKKSINRGLEQAIYWDRATQIKSIAVIFKINLIVITIEEWDNGQRF